MVNYINNCTKDDLINFQNTRSNKEIIIIKFEADWCKPCQNIKEPCNNLVKLLNDNVTYVVVDIDEHIELYAYLKTKKQITGIPTLLAYYGGKRDQNEWFLPNDSIIGSNLEELNKFFNRCEKYSR